MDVKNNLHLPHIGMRIVKTVVAVWICLLLDRWHGSDPLIAAFAAVICTQSSMQQTFVNARQRMWATLVGGVLGGLAMWLAGLLQLERESLAFFSLAAFLLIPVIYILVSLEKRGSIQLACIVFLIILFNHGLDHSPLKVAFDRTASTLLGIVVAGVVNAVLPGKHSSFQQPANGSGAPPPAPAPREKDAGTRG